MMKRNSIIISILALLVVMRVSAQGVSFHSEDFANAVKYHIGLDESADVSTSQLDTITVLDLSGHDLTDLRDVVNLPNVRNLNLEGNKIENVAPLANLDSLRVLNLCHNQLESINELVFSQSPEMIVDVAFNYIQDFSCFTTFTTCCFTIEGTSFQSVKNAPYFDVRELHADLIADNVIDVFYRGYTNMPDQPILTIGLAESEALVDGDIHIVTVSDSITETAQVTLTNGQISETTYVVPPKEYQVEAGETVILETGLPDDYILSYASAKVGTINIDNNTIEYKAPDIAEPDTVYFSYYQGSTLKGSTYYYINKGIIPTVPIKIGSNGKTTYTGDKDLDFSFSDEVKAFIATGFDKAEGIIWMTRVKDVPAGVPVMIKGTADETYNVPVAESSASYYKNMFKGNISGETVVINATEENEELGTLQNYYMSKGQFVSVNGTAKIGNNKCYLQLPANFQAEAQGEDQSVKIASTGKSSFASPVDLDFTSLDDDLKAFTATGYDANTKTVWLTRVKKVQKGEGLMLKGTGGETYTIPSAGVQASYVNMIVGNTSGDGIEIGEKSDDGLLTNYYLKGGTYMSVSVSANIGNNKSYLQLPTSMLAGARGEDAPDNVENLGISGTLSLTELETESMPLIFGSTTGIRTTDCTDYTDESHAVWYDLQGRKYDAQPTKKGIYIHKGRKVVVK